MEDTTVEEQQEQETVVEATEAVEPVEQDQPVEQSEEPPEPSTADLQAELAEARAALAQRDTEVDALRHQLTSATARYREALLTAAPEIPAELVTGATPEEVEASLAQARGMVERIRSNLEAQLAEQRVPTGAPIRSAPDVSALSARDKIAYALTRQDGQ